MCTNADGMTAPLCRRDCWSNRRKTAKKEDNKPLLSAYCVLSPLRHASVHSSWDLPLWHVLNKCCWAWTELKVGSLLCPVNHRWPDVQQ